ncbi:hypothetical protein RQM47_02885 [Rubrivirga sp. S365]|uniref:Uncharacterized protein n=1 Tax=Rubrivirga litoralis TaxID=3075598 RepID=A0ABU3BQW0_9BACT|nr:MULTISPECIES: hypothetical protein [unclassified Rubrivirga]MDT0631680.1 hypothetical protein [Rubrivirga sp. F394]MDT7855577.1 hypothetical protein [Rubrivirga sp. S365]
MRPLLLLSALLATGCAATGTQLEPAPAAETVAPETAVEVVDGVRMTAETGAWDGLARVKTEVTPLRVTIENGSRLPVRLRYDDFTLVSPQGGRYAALPPYGIEGDVADPVLVDAYAPVTAPGFAYSGFTVAPYYASVYPTLTPYAGSFGYDPLYYNRYYTAYREIALPTEEMVREALPEGVIDPGGRVSGFLYFERVPPSAPRVRFRADLVDARTGETFGEISIPFVVEE